MKNFDYNTVYPTIVDAVDCILKLSESVNDEELEKSCEKHEISFEETSIAYLENLKDKNNSIRNSKKHSTSYKIEEEDLDYYRKQSLTNDL